jgi:hypothetical protein
MKIWVWGEDHRGEVVFSLCHTSTWLAIMDADFDHLQKYNCSDFAPVKLTKVKLFILSWIMILFSLFSDQCKVIIGIYFLNT